eukprot:scaffold8.g1530.t1
MGATAWLPPPAVTQRHGGTAGPAPRPLPPQRRHAVARRARPLPPAAALKTSTKRAGAGRRGATYVQVEPDGSDAWRLDPVAGLLREGGVGIIPTDSNPAFVCDLESREALQRLVEMKGIAPSKRLSILVRDWAQIAKARAGGGNGCYTLGFPSASAPGQPDMFKLARRLLPGPYTFILLASKEMPKQVVNYGTGRSKSRSTVGVRMPDNPLCQALLAQLDCPLLCSSAKAADAQAGLLDPAQLLDIYGPRGLDFVVDAGPRVAEDSTVVDMTTGAPALVRRGKGTWEED